MEVDIDVYFWMVDRGLFDDDQRNKVDMDRNKVKLHREYSARFENGIYIGKIMLLLKKSIMKISKKPFTLDPGVANMKDNITSTAKQQNWNVITKELKKFGIRIDSEKKAKILEGRYQLINEILAKLFDFDNGGLQSGRFQDGNLSEIQYNNSPDREPSLERDTSLNSRASPVKLDPELQSEQIVLPNIKRNLRGAKLEASPRDSKLGIKEENPLSLVSSQQLTLKGVKTKKTSVVQSISSLNDLVEGKDLAYAETTLEFILISLSRSLGIKPKQAAGLLSNNYKYLVHIAVKGTKGADFSKIKQWYLDVYQHAQVLVQLIDNEKEQNSVRLTLNILKCGFLSTNEDLFVSCCRVLSKIGQEIQNYDGQLQGMAWDWIAEQGGGPQQGLNELQMNHEEMADIYNGTVKGNNIGAELPPSYESGLQTLVKAYQRTQQEGGYIDHLFPILIHFGRNNYVELFNHYLLKAVQNDNVQFITMIHDILYLFQHGTSALFQESILSSGVFDEWLNFALRLADIDSSLTERTASLVFLSDAWELNADRDSQQDTAQAILQVMKRGCRDRAKVLRTVAFELLFQILTSFAQNRNQFAPILYKSLTFLLIEMHHDSEMRELMVRNFIKLFQEVQSIPVAILCDPLIKQIEISQSGLNIIGAAVTNNPGAHTYIFNIFDFELFATIAQHKRLGIQTAVQIAELLVSIASQQLFFSNTAVQITLQIVHRYSKEPQLHQSFTIITRNFCLQLEESERQKQKQEQERKRQREQRQKEVSQSINKNGTNRFTMKKIQDQERQKENEINQEWEAASLARQTREKLIVNVLKQLILFGNNMIKQNIRNQLLESYTKIEKEIKTKSKCINYLLGLFGEDLPQMLQYFVETQHQQTQESLGNSSADTEKINMQIERVTGGLVPQNQLVLTKDPNKMEESLSPFRGTKKTKDEAHLERALKEIERVKNNMTMRKDHQQLAEELKRTREQKLIEDAKKKVDQRKFQEHGVVSKEVRNYSLDAKRENKKDQMQVQLKKAKDLDVSEIAIEDDQRLILPSLDSHQIKNPVLKQIKQIQLYDLRLEEQKDQDAVRFFVKKNMRILRNLFNRYANSMGVATNVKETFDSLHNKHLLITVAEILRMLKDFQVSNLQCSKDDVMQIVRLINMDILKKKDKGQASLTVLEFEGFVEFMLQLAVHLYSFEAQLSPSDYLQKLFSQMKSVAQKTGANNAKLFDDPSQFVVGDPKLIQELNRRLSIDPNYQLPDGFSKVVEKEVVNNYVVPDFVPLTESQKVSIEVLDELMNDAFGFHFLEPMSEVKEVAKAKPNLKQQAKDKIIHEINAMTNDPKHLYGMIKRANQDSRVRSRQAAKMVSNSIDANPIKNYKGNNSVIVSMGQRSRDTSLIRTPRPSNIQPKPVLGVELKLLVANAPATDRKQILETAYLMEEMLYSVENGLSHLPPPGFQLHQKARIVNRLIQQKQKKVEEDEAIKMHDKQKLELRKKMLRDQIERMKVEKDAKIKEDQEKVKEKEQKDKQKQQKREEKKKEEMKKIMVEIKTKKEQMKQSVEEKMKQEIQMKDTEQEKNKKDRQERLKSQKRKLDEEFKKKAEDRKTILQKEEEDSKKKQEKEKQKALQIKQMYAETKQKAREIKESMKQDFISFKQQPDVVQIFAVYEKSLLAQFEHFSKYDSKDPNKLSYNSYLKLGNALKITPALISIQDYIYIYKTTLRDQPTHSNDGESFTDIQGTRLIFSDFKDALLKVACLSKFKLGGLSGSDEEIRAKQEQMRKKQQHYTSSKAVIETLQQSRQKNGGSRDSSPIQKGEVVVGIFERDFDVANMTAQTMERLFKAMGIKPDRSMVGQMANQQEEQQRFNDQQSINEREGGDLNQSIEG